MTEILKLIGFIWPLLRMPLIVCFICSFPSVIIGFAFAKKGNDAEAWAWGNKAGWWWKNNNGWWTALLIATVLTFGIACRKIWTQPSITTWETRKVWSDPNRKETKILNCLLSTLKGSRVSEDPNGTLIIEKKDYPPIKVSEPKGPRPDYPIWWWRFLVYLLIIPPFTIYAFSDEVARAWQRHSERTIEEKKKDKKEQKSGLTLGMIFLSDMVAEIATKFMGGRH